MQEIGPANGNSQQSNDNGRRQIVPVNANQQIQAANKFADLQVEEQNNEGNQLVVVEDTVVQKSPVHKEFNPAAAVFTPKSTGVSSSKRGNETNSNGGGSIVKAAADRVKESTAQWDRVDFTGGRLWCQQPEEELDEGEFLDVHEDVEEVQDKEPDVEEQSVNGKSGGIEGQSAAEGNKVKGSAEQPLQVEQPNNSEPPANPINNPSLVEMNELTG
ncbi:hypothetical protein A4A49_09406 [Nicotiana attenuata]|uniref:Uncharacterized protein n=1 Tax=Nicotiana attenuata TaxID=49451 RepID=A0A1J6J1F6_NICAT|nr:hypothetical protein A4A49_09406 [Nicotiana attenuata]